MMVSTEVESSLVEEVVELEETGRTSSSSSSSELHKSFRMRRLTNLNDKPYFKSNEADVCACILPLNSCLHLTFQCPRCAALPPSCAPLSRSASSWSCQPTTQRERPSSSWQKADGCVRSSSLLFLAPKDFFSCTFFNVKKKATGLQTLFGLHAFYKVSSGL